MAIFHITNRHAWEHALEIGVYQVDTLDSSGFIHCCEPDHVDDVLKEWFPDSKDLVLLEINPDRVKSKIVYENLEGGQDLFPHIYGPINLDAVIAVKNI